MPVNSVAENVFGTIGTVCWTLQLAPQLWKSYRQKDTTGLSDWMIFAWGVSGSFLGTYTVVKNLNIPLILQPQLFGALALASWAQCQYYTRHRSLSTTLILYFSMIAILTGFEVGMVYALRPSYDRGESSGAAGVQFFGILSAVTIALALLPQYFEIYKHGEVIGISISFMLVDLLGGVFSDLSLVFKAGDFDTIAAVTYSVVVVMDAVVIVAALILNPRAKRRRRQLAERELESGRTEQTSTSDNAPDNAPEGMTQADTAPATIAVPSPTTTAQASPRSSSYVDGQGGLSQKDDR